MKKLLIALGVAVALVVLLLTIIIIKDLDQEEKLRQELNEIDSLINFEEFDYDKVNERLGKTISSGDYLVVEKAAKKYLKDTIDMTLTIFDIMNDETLINILTAENYLEDGPKFVETKKFLKEQKQKVLNLTAEMLADLETKTIMSYIIDKNLEDSYNNLYQNLIFAKEENLKKNKETIEKTVELYIKNNDNKQKVINFLENNNWTVKDNAIIFDEPELSNEYNELIMNLQ